MARLPASRVATHVYAGEKTPLCLSSKAILTRPPNGRANENTQVPPRVSRMPVRLSCRLGALARRKAKGRRPEIPPDGPLSGLGLAPPFCAEILPGHSGSSAPHSEAQKRAYGKGSGSGRDTFSFRL